MDLVIVRSMERPDIPGADAVFRSYDLLKGKPLAMVFEFLSSTPCAINLVAQQDDEIVGALLAHFNGFHVFLSHMAVAPSLRSKGIGKAMHRELEVRAKALGARGVIVDSWTSAAGFYESLGYRVPGAAFMIRSFEE